MSGNTVRLHRVFATQPEKLFRAFLDADAMAEMAVAFHQLHLLHRQEIVHP